MAHCQSLMSSSSRSSSVSSSSSSRAGGRAAAAAAPPSTPLRVLQHRRSPLVAAAATTTTTSEPRAQSGAGASTSGGGPGMVPAASAAPKAYVKRSVSLWDAFKFNGAAPEIVNGRLAMAALLYVARREAESGETALALLTAPAAWYEYAWVALVVYASMVPILKGARHESFFAFSTRAEFANGRAAMLGWAALLLLERQAGVPFF